MRWLICPRYGCANPGFTSLLRCNLRQEGNGTYQSDRMGQRRRFDDRSRPARRAAAAASASREPEHGTPRQAAQDLSGPWRCARASPRSARWVRRWRSSTSISSSNMCVRNICRWRASNVLIPNPEWFDNLDEGPIAAMQGVLAKTRHAEAFFRKRLPATQFIGFTSRDRRDGDSRAPPRLLPSGRSQQEQEHRTAARAVAAPSGMADADRGAESAHGETGGARRQHRPSRGLSRRRRLAPPAERARVPHLSVADRRLRSLPDGSARHRRGDDHARRGRR